MFSTRLRGNRAGKVLTLLGIITTLTWMTMYTVRLQRQHPEQARRKHLTMEREYVVVNAVLNEVRGSLELTGPDEKKAPSSQQFKFEELEPSDSLYFQLESGDNKRGILRKPKYVGLEPCSIYPTENLLGSLASNKACVAPEDLQLLYPDVERGGRVRPQHCLPQEKTAIIIPFRGRFTHLYVLLNNLIPFIQRQLVDVRFFLIEQASHTIFNRAALFNVGFLEALKVDNFDCFIFHDVDLIPLNDRNLYRCDEHPVHFAVAMDKYQYKLPYPKYFGGVVGFTREQYIRINGHSNLFFGWGGEDDDLYRRVVAKDYEITRPIQDVGKYDMIRHTPDEGNDDNCDRLYLLNSSHIRQDIEGLNTIKYKKNYVVLKPLVTWINVFLDMDQLLATAPKFVQKQMEFGHMQRQNKSCADIRGPVISA